MRPSHYTDCSTFSVVALRNLSDWWWRAAGPAIVSWSPLSRSRHVTDWCEFSLVINVRTICNNACRLFAIHWLNPICFMTAADLLVHTRSVNEESVGGSGRDLHQMTHFQEPLKWAVVNDYKCPLSYFQVSPDFISKSTLAITGGFSQWRDVILPDRHITVLGRVPSLSSFYIARRENSVAIMKTTAWTVTDRGRHFSLSRASRPAAVVPTQSSI
jgi:hypothetical protein